MYCKIQYDKKILKSDLQVNCTISFLFLSMFNAPCMYCKGTHNADSIIESKVIYYFEQCGLRV